MLKLLTAPATNDRGPRGMEKALAAIHQANHAALPVSLSYAAVEGRGGPWRAGWGWVSIPRSL
jgi:hypothetical protein